MVRNIVLIGFMGSGKTTVGKRIAQELNMKFIDTDNIIEDQQQMNISEIFERYGEDYFRNIERDVIKQVSSLEGCVISTGGGIVKNEDNITVLKDNGILFYLKATSEKLYDNLRNDVHNRPLLKGNELEVLDKITVLLKEREELYKSAADYIINIDSRDIIAVAERIIDIMKFIH